MNTDLMVQVNSGLMIAVIGMGVVMCFLVLMMFVMRITEKIMEKLAIYFPEEVKEEPKRNIQSGNNDSDLAIVIAAAKNFLARGGN